MDKDLEEILTIATLELGDNKKTLPKLKRIKSKIIEIQSNRLEKLVMPKIAEIKMQDYERLGDTFIDCKNDAPLTQWRIIAGMLSAEGMMVVKK